jgi:hypothetical protein
MYVFFVNLKLKPNLLMHEISVRDQEAKKERRRFYRTYSDLSCEDRYHALISTAFQFNEACIFGSCLWYIIHGREGTSTFEVPESRLITWYLRKMTS